MTSWRYNLLLHFLLPFLFVRLLWRGRITPAYKQNMAQRFGGHKNLPQGGIVIHAVSLGETVASQPLVNALLAQYPDIPIIITNTTATGAERARTLWGDKVTQCYLPYDYRWAMSRFLSKSAPRLIIVMETELWPNFLAQAQQQKIPVVLANARLSEKSAAGYAKVESLVKPMLNALSVLAVQDQDTAQRFLDLGAPSEVVQVTGSLKFDLTIADNLVQQADELREQWHLQQRPVWVAASTHEGEDEIVLQAFKTVQQTFANALLILVPRHPERFDAVFELINKQGFAVTRRSQQQVVGSNTEVFLADSMGELLLWLALADVAFVGGSFVKVGGHNPLEPAALAVPIVTGQTMFNFKQITEVLVQAGALKQVTNSNELAQIVVAWLQNPEQKQQAGQAGLQVVNANKGALAKHLVIVDRLLKAI